MRTDLAAGPRTWLLAALAGWCLLAWVLALSGMGGRVDALAADPSMTQPLPRLPASAQERLGTLSQYSEISARPLFSSDRRPQPFFIAGDGNEPVQAFDFLLSSVMITPGLKMAILQPIGGGDPIRLQLGESPPSMSNWQLVELQPRSASFAGPEGPRTLELRVFDGAGGQAPTPLDRVPPAAPMAGTSSPGAERPVAAPVSAPVAEPTPAPDPILKEDPADFPDAASAQPSEQTTQQQMEAIRQRIEARRAQLRQNEPPPPTNKTP